ncbi:MAG: hypothetical protein N3A54_03065 [Patescibacteria group bacterium]|nr:hypothetical protein [Patescibacteria group bacterium]
MKSGLYAWGGPGTIRLLRTKYFASKIDEASFLRMYDKEFLDRAKNIFKTTDMFVTYSWGFSNETEKEDRRFIVSRLKNFENIRSYAYIQGLNLVYKDFSQDLWCKNPHGKPMFYSKGRAFTCPNNPNAVSILLQRVEDAVKHAFFGIFVDNIIFGLPPIYVYQNETSFFGCSCHFCQKEFKTFAGYSLPLNRKKGFSIISDYLLFRRTTIKKLIQRIAQIVHSAGKAFGVNLYDPYWHTSVYYFGYVLEDIEPYLDYLLFENHALKRGTIDNRHIRIHPTKPTFIVSYKKGIGRDAAYSQHDMNLIFSESQQLGYIPCYKATEYKTDGIWHGLYIDVYHEPSWTIVRSKKIPNQKRLSQLSLSKLWFVTILNSMHFRIFSDFPEHRLFSYILFESPLFTYAVKKRQWFLDTT